MNSLNFGKILTGDATHEDFLPTDRNGASEKQTAQAVNKRRENLEKKKRSLCYELFQALDKNSVLFLRPQKGDET